MPKFYLLLSLCGAILLCGCDKQAKINNQKIDLLTKQIIQLEQAQSKQAALLQSQLISLAPQLDKMNSSYFEKNRDDALFFHTNTLYLLLTIGQQIEAQLQTADAERTAQNQKAYAYYTNQVAATYLGTTQIQQALNEQQNRIQENINAETRRVSLALSDVLLKQIKLSTTPDVSEANWRSKMESVVAQIQSDLGSIKAMLANTNTPPIH